MKIKKRVKDNVKNAVQDCKNAIMVSIKELCAQVDYKKSGYIGFEKPVPLTTSMMIHERHLETKTHFVDRIGWCSETDYFTLYYDGEILTSSIWMSVDELLAVYKALEKVVKSF